MGLVGCVLRRHCRGHSGSVHEWSVQVPRTYDMPVCSVAFQMQSPLERHLSSESQQWLTSAVRLQGVSSEYSPLG